MVRPMPHDDLAGVSMGSAAQHFNFPARTRKRTVVSVLRLTSRVRGHPLQAESGADGRRCEVAVVIPAYNRADLVGRAIDSALAQTLPPAEVIVVDDASTDGTAEAAESGGARVIQHSENRGPAATRNSALEAVTQPWVAFLDSDDEWLPHHLATLWPLRTGHDLVAAAAIWPATADSRRRMVGWPWRRTLTLTSPNQLLYPECPISQSGVMLRREAIDRAGGYDEQLWLGEDMDLYARILRNGGGIVSPIVTSLCYRHSNQATADSVFVRRKQRLLIERYAGCEWSDGKVLDRMLVVTMWDELRFALAQHSWGDALAKGRALIRNRATPSGLIGLWRWRYRARHPGGSRGVV